MMRRPGWLAAIVCLLIVADSRAGNWPRFRGPGGAGQGEAVEHPLDWTVDDYLWQHDLSGSGHSSPVVWDERLFVTSADLTTGRQFVEAFHTRSGRPMWQREFAGAAGAKHFLNSYASSTPAVDADRLYVAWATDTHVNIAALSHDDGEPIWQRELGGFTGQHGFGASPILVDDLIILANDDAGESYIAALDAATGQPRWTLPRPSAKTSYATPCVVTDSAGEKLIVQDSISAGMSAVRIADGQIAWQLADVFPERCVSSPVVAGGLLLGTCGDGNGGKLLVAVQPDGDQQRADVAYQLTRGVPYVPSPLVVGDLLFLCHDRGTVSCVEVESGRTIWNERLGGTIFSSPVAAGGRVYCVSTDGTVSVLAAERTFQLMGKGSLGGPSHATPAVADGHIYFRTETAILCLGPAGQS